MFITLALLFLLMVFMVAAVEFFKHYLNDSLINILKKLSNGRLFCNHKYVHTHVIKYDDAIGHILRCEKCNKEKHVLIHKTKNLYTYSDGRTVTEVTDYDIKTETIGYRIQIDDVDFLSFGNYSDSFVKDRIASKIAEQIVDRLNLERYVDVNTKSMVVRGKIRVVKDGSLEPLSWNKHAGPDKPNPFIDHDDDL